jgi:hypothetical protein
MHECDQVLDMAFLVAACVACSGFQSKRFSMNFPATPLLFSKMFDLKDCRPGKFKASPVTEAVSMVCWSLGGVLSVQGSSSLVAAGQPYILRLGLR